MLDSDYLIKFKGRLIVKKSYNRQYLCEFQLNIFFQKLNIRILIKEFNITLINDSYMIFGFYSKF